MYEDLFAQTCTSKHSLFETNLKFISKTQVTSI